MLGALSSTAAIHSQPWPLSLQGTIIPFSVVTVPNAQSIKGGNWRECCTRVLELVKGLQFSWSGSAKSSHLVWNQYMTVS